MTLRGSILGQSSQKSTPDGPEIAKNAPEVVFAVSIFERCFACEKNVKKCEKSNLVATGRDRDKETDRDRHRQRDRDSKSETERQTSSCGFPSCTSCVHMYIRCLPMYITFVAGRLLKVISPMSVSNWVVAVVYFSAWDTKKRPSMWHEGSPIPSSCPWAPR